MRLIQIVFAGLLALLGALWGVADTSLFSTVTFLSLRDTIIQFSGVIAIGLMSVTLVLALRPHWPEQWMGGLDKLYRLHKWLGITILVTASLHWLWAEGPKWASALGLWARGARPPRVPVTDPVAAVLSRFSGLAETIGEWAFYAAALLIILALVKYIPYRFFYKTHRLLAVVYLALAFHAIILLRFTYWASPLGLLVALLLACGIFAALIHLLGLSGKGRQAWGRIVSLQSYPGVRSLEIGIDMAPNWQGDKGWQGDKDWAGNRGWQGHKAGQFAFAQSNPIEGPHPYTIASDWEAGDSTITFIVKELGDHTSRLKSELKVGEAVRIEGPYGCFTFDDACEHQIWIAGGIGITPFIARMKHMAQNTDTPDWPKGQVIDLFLTSTEVDERVFAKLAAEARIANIRFHLMIDARDGYLTGERLRATIPGWATASVWFCGPAGFGAAIRTDLAAHGFPTGHQFHQELFAFR